MAKINLNDIQSIYDLTQLNQDFADIESEFQNKVLYRDNPTGEPNQMENNLDMNSNAILNAKTDLTDPGSLLTLGDADARYLNASGDTLESGINANGFKITNLGIPSAPSDAARLADVGPDSAATLRTELASSTAGEGSDLIAHTGTTDTVTEALDKRTVFVGSVAELEALSLPSGYNIYLTEDGRAGEFVIKSGTPPADTQKGFYIILANGNYAERIVKSPATPEMFGALFDGSDDADAWNGLASVIEPGTIVTSSTPGGTSTCLSEVLFTKDVVFDFPEITVNITGGDFKVTGSIAAITATLSADADKGDFSISVSDESGFSAGDLIIIQNDDNFSFSAHRANYKDGEFLEVLSTSTGVVNFYTELKSSYLSSGNILFYKVTPVTLKVKGLKVTGDGIDRLFYADMIKDIDLNHVEINGGVNSATMLRRCFGGTITGGKHKNTAAAGGTQYGIIFANCQNITVYSAECFGTRHGVATGGFDGAGAVPCRNLQVVRSTVSSTDSHGADIHGNAEDCYYVDCDISNGTGIGGKNCGVIGGSVKVPPGYGQPVLMLVEVVGGTIKFSGIKAALPESSGASGFGVNSTATMADIEQDFKYELTNTEFFIPASNTSVGLGTFTNTADGALVNWDVECRGIKVTGDVSGLSRFCTARLSNPSLFATPPNAVTKFVIDDIEIDYSGLSFWVVNSGSPIATGSEVTLPKIEFSGDETIPNGGYVSSGLSLSFPSYLISPNIYTAYTGIGVAGTTFVLPLCTESTATTATIALTTMHTSETVGIEVTKRVTGRVGFDEFVWP